MLPDAASDEDLVDAAMVDAHACATDDAACGKFCEKVLAETTADISEAQRRARMAWKAITNTALGPGWSKRVLRPPTGSGWFSRRAIWPS